MLRVVPNERSGAASPRHLPLLRWLFLLTTVATFLAGLWLIFVIAVVLPARDPAHVPFWSAVLGGLGLYEALCVFFFRRSLRGASGGILPIAVLLLSVAAIGSGAWGLATEARVARDGGHFEGYLVLLGLILIAHGLAAVAFTLASRRADGRPHRS
jgi:hypothetical protein